MTTIKKVKDTKSKCEVCLDGRRVYWFKDKFHCTKCYRKVQMKTRSKISKNCKLNRHRLCNDCKCGCHKSTKPLNKGDRMSIKRTLEGVIKQC